MLKFLKNALLLGISLALALGLGELGLYWYGVERFQTWIEMHPSGFVHNEPNRMAWQE